MTKQIKYTHKFYISFFILSFLSLLLVINTNFGYKNIFYLDLKFDQNYIHNIKRNELDKISQIPKNYFISKIKNPKNYQIKWKNKCDIISGILRCAGVSNVRFNFWTINQLPNKIDNIVLYHDNSLDYEKFIFNTENYLKFTYDTEYFYYSLFDNFEIFKNGFLKNVMNFTNKELTKKTLSNYYAHDLKNHFQKRFKYMDVYNRNDHTYLPVLLYMKILTIFIFSILMIFYFLKILFKNN